VRHGSYFQNGLQSEQSRILELSANFQIRLADANGGMHCFITAAIATPACEAGWFYVILAGGRGYCGTQMLPREVACFTALELV
jgi:hypothetical protein